MKTTLLKLFKFYFLGDMCVLVLALTQGSPWVINTQIAFVCSVLITLASFRSYHQVVKQHVDAGVIPKDTYDKYFEDDENEHVPEKEVSVPKIGFKQGVQNLGLSYKGALSLYRIASYGVLFIAVLFLIRHNQFDAVAFFVGLSVVPLASIARVLFMKKD